MDFSVAGVARRINLTIPGKMCATFLEKRVILEFEQVKFGSREYGSCHHATAMVNQGAATPILKTWTLLHLPFH